MPRNIKAGGEEGEGAAGGAEDRARVSHALGAHPSGHYDPSVETFAIQERAGAENPNSWPDGKGWQKEKAFTLEARQRAQGVVHSLRGEGFDASEDGTGRGTPIVIDRAAFNAGEGAQFSPQIGPSETAPTVQERGPSAVLPTAMRMREGKPGGGKGPLLSKDVSLSLATGNDQVLFAPDGKPQAFYAEQSRTDNLPKEDQAPPLKTSEKASVAIPIQDGRASRPNQNGTGAGDPGDPSFTLDSKGSQAVYDMRGNGDGEVCPTISKSSAGDRVADFAPMVFESRIARNGRGAPEPISPPLKAQSGETGKGDAAPLVFTQGNLERGAGPSPSSESCPTLKAQEGRGKSDQDPLVFTQNSRSEVRKVGGDGQIAGALAADHGAQQQNYIQNSMQVRRLTPRECERLQGFPDDYTLIPWRSARDEDQDYCETVNYLLESGFDVKSAMELADTPDGPRYKALGNSMCVDVMEWLGRRIQAVQDVLDAADKPKRKR